MKPANILLEKHLEELGFIFEREYRFDKSRRWKADYRIGWPSHNRYGGWDHALLEIEGSVYAQGRHTRGKGFEADCEKYNTATMMGYKVLRFSTGQVLRGEAKAFIGEWAKR